MFRVWSTMLFLEVPMNKAVEFTRVFIIGSQREQVGRGFTCCFSCQYLLFTCGYQTVAYVNIQRSFLSHYLQGVVSEELLRYGLSDKSTTANGPDSLTELIVISCYLPCLIS